jgi:hypothetical protein
LTHNAAERAQNSIAKKPKQRISEKENFITSQCIAIGKKTWLEAAPSFRSNTNTGQSHKKHQPGAASATLRTDF